MVAPWFLWGACTPDDPSPSSEDTDEPEVRVYPCDAAPPALSPSPIPDGPAAPLVTANGATSVVLDGAIVATWTDGAVAEARDRLGSLALGVRIDGVGTWLDEVPIDGATYEPGTGIVRLEQVVGDVRVVTRVVAPLQGDAGADLVVAVEAESEGAGATIELWATIDARPGGGELVDGEVAQASHALVVEARGEDVVEHRALPAAAHALVAPGDPRPLLAAAGDLPDEVEDGDDVRVTFQWAPAALGPGESTTAAIALSPGDGAWLDGADPLALLEAERALWDTWHAADVFPAGLDDDELAVARQATATLRMGTLRGGPMAGGLLGALAPGGRNALYTRDAAFGALALARTGHRDEAARALSVLLLEDGVPLSHALPDGTPAFDVADCPGGGDAGSNAAYDTLGWFLWAWAEAGDPALDDVVRDAVLTPLVELVDPTTGRLPPDGGFQGRHEVDCPPEGHQVHSVSAIAVAAGIRASAGRLGRPEHLDVADLMVRALLAPADRGGPSRLEARGDDELCPVLLSSPEEACESCDPLDALAAEIVTQALVEPTGPLARATLQALLEGLVVGDGPGLRATDDADDPAAPERPADLRESVVADLRVALALDALGDRASAEVLFDRVTAAARANQDRVPEALSHEDPRGVAQGAVPLVGLGAGAWLLTLDALRGG
jgi:hypothetical protein